MIRSWAVAGGDALKRLVVDALTRKEIEGLQASATRAHAGLDVRILHARAAEVELGELRAGGRDLGERSSLLAQVEREEVERAQAGHDAATNAVAARPVRDFVEAWQMQVLDVAPAVPQRERAQALLRQLLAAEDVERVQLQRGERSEPSVTLEHRPDAAMRGSGSGRRDERASPRRRRLCK